MLGTNCKLNFFFCTARNNALVNFDLSYADTAAMDAVQALWSATVSSTSEVSKTTTLKTLKNLVFPPGSSFLTAPKAAPTVPEPDVSKAAAEMSPAEASTQTYAKGTFQQLLEDAENELVKKYGELKGGIG